MHVLAILGGLSLVSGTILLFMYDEIVYQTVALVARRYISPDHQITPLGQQLIRRIAYLVMTGPLLVGTTLVGLANASLRERARQAFTYRPAGPEWGLLSPGRLFLLSTSLGILFFALFYYKRQLPPALFQEDNLFEWATALLLFAAAFLVGRAALTMRASPIGPSRRWVVRGYLLISVLCFLVAMEEISWGQRIVGWETPPAWAEINYQDETTLHNVIPDRVLFNLLPLLLLPPVLLALALGFGQRQQTGIRLLLPPPALMGLALIIALPILVSLPSWELLDRFANDELLEPLVALFAFFYGIEVGTRQSASASIRRSSP
jgi:hypothetical protein